MMSTIVKITTKIDIFVDNFCSITIRFTQQLNNRHNFLKSENSTSNLLVKLVILTEINYK